MLKKLFIALLFIFPMYTYGQGNSEIIKNDNAKLTIISSLKGAFSSFLSPDGNYLSGNFGGSAGFIYDIRKDTALIYEEYNSIVSVVSPQHFIGHCVDVPGAFIFKDGKRTLLERTDTSESKEWSMILLGNMSEDGSLIGAMSYTPHPFVSSGGENRVQHINYGAIFDGTTGKHKQWLKPLWPLVDPFYDEDNTGYSSRIDALSPDGTIALGHGSYPGAFSNWTPMFWDLQTGKTFAMNPDRFNRGSFYCSNKNSSVFAGDDEGIGCGIIAYYDRTNNSFSVDTLSALPGYDLLSFATITNDTTVYGYQQLVANPSSRVAVVYNKLTGLITMKEYLREFYDLDIKQFELFVPFSASPDGKTISGFANTSSWQPWVIQLGEPILPGVRRLSAKASLSALLVSIEWSKPINTKNTILGYNVYRDSTTKINQNLIDPNTLKFVDNTLEAGTHIYSIEVVYEEGSSIKRYSNSVLALAGGSCYPVQEIGSRVKYNTFASIYWGRPSSEIVSEPSSISAYSSKEKRGESDFSGTNLPSLDIKSTAKSFENLNCDYASSLDMEMYDGYSGILVGDKYYLSNHKNGGLFVYDMSNTRLDLLQPTGLGATLSMVYHNGVLYCGTTDAVFSVDLNEPSSVSNYFPVPSGRHLTFIPSLDNGKGGFEVGDWESSFFYTLDGDPIGESGFDFSELAVSGTAFHDGKLYVASQTGKHLNEIYIYDFESKQPIGEPIQVNEDPALYNILTNNGAWPLETDAAIAGGLSLNTLDDGTTALGLVLQCTYINCRLAMLEIESSPELRGYNLYRNGVKVNEEVLTSRRYYDKLDEAGDYTYTVKPVTEQNATSETAPETVVSINPKGDCFAPINLKAVESNSYAMLSWGVNEATTGLVGFNIYRDNELISQLWEENLTAIYIDKDVELGKHTYTVETFNVMSCAKSDSVKIDITGEGVSKAPIGLQLTYKNGQSSNKYDVTASWETPMYEEPMAIRYGLGMWTASLTLEDKVTEYYAAIGWDSTSLDIYRDLYLIGVEFLVGNSVSSLEGIVYLNDTMVYTKDAGKVRPGQWQTILFDKYFSMDQPDEVAVGYHTIFTKENHEGVIAIDQTGYDESYVGRADLLSFDGIAYTTLAAGNYPSSWCIAGLVVRKRDIENATKNGVFNPDLIANKVMRFTPNTISNKLTVHPIKTSNVSAKSALTLKGFNIYRDDFEMSLNNGLIKDFSYTDLNVNEGEYVYTVGAVYQDQELTTEKWIEIIPLSNENGTDKLSIAIYPNPASDIINVNGEYDKLQVLDLSGKTVLKSNSQKNNINISRLNSGTYIFHFINKDGQSADFKIIVK